MQYDPIRDNYYTSGQLADAMHVKPGTVRAWARRGRVPYVKLGTVLLFPKKDIRVYLQRRLRK